MEVLKSGDVPALVTNIEVMNILSKRIENRQEEGSIAANDIHMKKTNPKLRHRDFIEEKVLEYLQTTPCANVELQRMPELISKLNGWNVDSVNETVKSDGDTESIETTTGYRLMDAEILQILNLMPTEKVEAHLMIEQLENRMDDHRQDQLLQLISEYAGHYPEVFEEELVKEEL